MAIPALPSTGMRPPNIVSSSSSDQPSGGDLDDEAHLLGVGVEGEDGPCGMSHGWVFAAGGKEAQWARGIFRIRRHLSGAGKEIDGPVHFFTQPIRWVSDREGEASKRHFRVRGVSTSVLTIDGAEPMSNDTTNATLERMRQELSWQNAEWEKDRADPSRHGCGSPHPAWRGDD